MELHDDLRLSEVRSFARLKIFCHAAVECDALYLARIHAISTAVTRIERRKLKGIKP
jgi:hypothetical protein